MSNLVNVFWQEPKTRSRHKVGELRKVGDEFEFSYVNNVDHYISLGFQIIFPFVELNKKYKLNKLFSAFTCRLPNKNRVDIDEILNKYGLAEYDEFELLKASEGRIPSDSLEFIESLYVDNFPFSKEMYVAGVRHCDLCDENICELDNVVVGQKLEIVKELNNEYDPNAIMLTINNKKLGYIPCYYSEDISQLLNKKFNIDCEIVSIDKYKKDILKGCRECILVKITITK